jgi:DNA-binding NarL/FixJ family response regulator
MTIRLLVADDQPVSRKGVFSIIQGTEIELVGEAATCCEAIQFTRTFQPDVLLLDLHMPDDSGLNALAAIAREQPGLAVLMWCESVEMKEMACAYRIGAKGFISKAAPREMLLQSLREVAAGKSAWNLKQLQMVACRAAQKASASGSVDPLSSREQEVLDLIIVGKTNKHIAATLGIGAETVKQYVRHLLRKLHVETRTQAALWAMHPSYGVRPADISKQTGETMRSAATSAIEVPADLQPGRQRKQRLRFDPSANQPDPSTLPGHAEELAPFAAESRLRPPRTSQDSNVASGRDSDRERPR